ncbi:MAG: hypothetical protein ACI8S6_000686 [Myxococcota bacterium]
MSLFPCTRCATPLAPTTLACPHCGAALEPGSTIRPAALLLVGLAACGDKDDTGETYTQPAYGDAIDTGWTDDDGDGYSEQDGDCDDDNDAIYPDAEETVGDGVDSNCDGEDDT